MNTNYEYYIHDLSPFVIRFYENIGIRWYGLSYLIGFVASYFLISWISSKQKMGLTANMVSDFISYCAVGTLVGGRLGYCLFYSPDLFLKFKSTLPFWGVLAVNEGGMASHGGMIGIVLACMLFARKHNLSSLYLFDLVCLCGPVGVFFGRIANFINGELVGRPIQSDVSWAVKFPTDMYNWNINDTQKFADLSAAFEKLGGSRDQWMSYVEKMKYDPASREFVNEFITKIIDQLQNGNQALKPLISHLLIPRHPSQLYAALLEGLFIFIVLFIMWRKPKKLGVIAATFGFLYSSVRVFDEFYRMPDAHIGLQLFDFSRGQWLSVGLAIVTLTLGIIWSRSVTKSSPGWGRLDSIKIGRNKA